MHKSTENDIEDKRYLLEMIPISRAEHERDTHVGRWLMPTDQWSIWYRLFVTTVPCLPAPVAWLALDYLWIRCDVGSLVDFAHQRKRREYDRWVSRDITWSAFDPMWRVAAWTRNGDGLHLERRESDGSNSNGEDDENDDITSLTHEVKLGTSVSDVDSDDEIWINERPQRSWQAKEAGAPALSSYMMAVPNLSMHVRPQPATVSSGKREAQQRAQAEREMMELKAARHQIAEVMKAKIAREAKRAQKLAAAATTTTTGGGGGGGGMETKQVASTASSEGKSENKEDDNDNDHDGESLDPDSLVGQVVDIIIDTTGCDAKQALEALEACNSDPEEAIALLQRKKETDAYFFQTQPLPKHVGHFLLYPVIRSSSLMCYADGT
jgi:NACalpha-BTF3-like transcription factor